MDCNIGTGQSLQLRIFRGGQDAIDEATRFVEEMSRTHRLKDLSVSGVHVGQGWMPDVVIAVLYLKEDEAN